MVTSLSSIESIEKKEKERGKNTEQNDEVAALNTQGKPTSIIQHSGYLATGQVPATIATIATPDIRYQVYMTSKYIPLYIDGPPYKATARMLDTLFTIGPQPKACPTSRRGRNR